MLYAKHSRLTCGCGCAQAIALATLALLAPSLTARADGPADNLAENVRRIPREGIPVPPQDKAALDAGLNELNGLIGRLRQSKDARVQSLLPDVIIFHRAAYSALTYNEFFAPNEIKRAGELLAIGKQRAEQLLQGQAPWATETGLVVRGYVSRIDGSVQPYGLVIPPNYSATGTDRVRLDIWCHGRGETLSELNFIDGRLKSRGQFAPDNTIVLHPYGRYCNANKFAGEVDVLEGIESVKDRYRIDDDRIVARGFSMGGASAWQFAVHYSDRWCAANPGAGFSETPEFLKFFQKETLDPTWYEKKLWHWYDCTDWAINLTQCPTVAYSGELDIQKQAADIMALALKGQGIELTHIIGPGTKHAYHPAAAATVEGLIGSIVERGRERLPEHVRMATYTLKYNRMNWVTVDAMGEHWERATADATLRDDDNAVDVKTANVTGLTLAIPAGWAPFDMTKPVKVTIDGQSLDAPRAATDRSWRCPLVKSGDKWAVGELPGPGDALIKRHNLQGPIDDAFMDSFIMVRPTGKCGSAAVQKWVDSEMAHAIEHWRRHFRGEARVKDDTAITDADIASANLILWGDPSANKVLAKVADRLPIQWKGDAISVGGKSYAGEHHAVIEIYPNPLNPQRYIVLNSGFTFREYDYLNNARQTPKLPDWAIVDVRTPPNARWPGKIVDANFFDEAWRMK